MRKPLLLLAALLSACVMNTKPAPSTPAPTPQPQGFVVNARLGLPAYPGSTTIKRERGDGSSEADFSTADDLNTVYLFFNTQLVLKGWTRLSLSRNQPATKITALYSKSGTQLRFSLDQKGKSGKYTLSLEF
ncbi:MAG: hypothetical protein C4331_09415 [Meiothermus sp.]